MNLLKHKIYNPISIFIHEKWAANYPVCYAKYLYRRSKGQKLNLKNPKTLDEKNFWLRIYSDLSQWTELADKYKVRDYIKQCGLSHILVKLYGVWDNAEDIDFNKLPDKFVLKTNHGFSRIILVTDKNQIEPQKVKKQLDKWVKEKYGLVSFEPHYLNIPRKIIAEEYLEDFGSRNLSSSLIDYKFFCINGKPEIIKIMCDRQMIKSQLNEPGYKTFAVDLDWNLRNDIIPETNKRINYIKIPKPKCLEEMKEIANILAKPFPQLRVDLYEVNGKVYFGELTFTPGGGQNFTHKYLIELGEKIDLSMAKLRTGKSIV